MGRPPGKIAGMGKILTQNFRAFLWAYRIAGGALWFLAILGLGGPKAAHMSGLVDLEVWLTNHTADPIAFAFLSGLILATWVIPEIWTWAKRHLHIEAAPDIPISDAINYIVNDSVAVLKNPSPPHIEEVGPLAGQMIRQGGVRHADALNKLQGKFVSGEAAVWGRRAHTVGMPGFERFPREIPRDYWDHAFLSSMPCFYKTETVPQTSVRVTKSDYQYTKLEVCSDQMRRIWPQKPLFRRISNRLRGVKRRDFWGRPIDTRNRLIDPNQPPIFVNEEW